MIQQDKIEHWAFGFVFTLFAIIDPAFVWFGIAFAFGKETYDHFYGKGWCWLDLMATLIGVQVALLFLWVIAI